MCRGVNQCASLVPSFIYRTALIRVTTTVCIVFLLHPASTNTVMSPHNLDGSLDGLRCSSVGAHRQAVKL